MDVQVDVTDSASVVLVVSTPNLTLTEGGTRTFTVRLADAPDADVLVNVARGAGDADLSVSSGAQLTFTPANYATPQIVTIAAAEDADGVNDTATFTVSAAGAQSRRIAPRWPTMSR